MKHLLSLLGFLLLSTFSALPQKNSYAIQNVTVIPMNREVTLPNQTVLVENGVISNIGAASELKIPKGVAVLEGKGKYLMPGLVDIHAHFFYEQGDNKNTCRDELKMMLANAASAAPVRPGSADAPPTLRHVRPALRERQFPHRPHHGVHPGRRLGAVPAHAGPPGALRRGRRRARRSDHDRRREGGQDAAAVRGRHRRGPQGVPGRFPHRLRQLALDRRRREPRDRPGPSISGCVKNELIEVRSIEQFYDPDKGMFLPDRFIKGECPKCGAQDQYGDSCESCGAVYTPTELKNPYSALSGATPVLKTSEHFFFRLSDPRCVEFLEAWTQDDRLQPEVANKVRENNT